MNGKVGTQYVVGLIDCQSFYTSCECATRPEYALSRTEDNSLSDPCLVVSGDPKRRSAIILAATPTAKQLGVSTAMTLGEALRLDKRREMVVVQPRMQTYIDFSTRIQETIKQHYPLQEQFSVDEAFFSSTLTGRFNDPVEYAAQLKEKVWDLYRIRVRIGLAPNKWLAKMTNSIAKKSKDGIVWWREDEALEKLWELPVSSMWGIKRRGEVLQTKFGAETIGDVARIPAHSLRHVFGPAWGTIIYRWSHGQDPSPVDPNSYDAPHSGYSQRMTLPRDYRREEVNVLALELIDKVCARVRRAGLKGRRISIGATYAGFTGGFWKSQTLSFYSNDASELYPLFMKLFDRWWNGKDDIRALSVGLDNLIEHESNQLSLFDDVVRQDHKNQIVDEIRDRFGETAIFRCSSLLPVGQMIARSGKKIGGHFA
ncbi:DNA polymerase IV [Alicyclobacillus fodiniaquatilis]|uniref:DNA polymerase IV n=1 Tax=Alicyclobacillus fodiniaquatilis TaxID=1661150 RepID=A0ABW4JGJ9_9BACL